MGQGVLELPAKNVETILDSHGMATVLLRCLAENALFDDLTPR